MDGIVVTKGFTFMKLFYLLTAGLFILYTSCKQEEICLQPQVIVCRSGFYKTDSALTYTDSALGNANILFQAQDTLYQINLKNNSRFSMPLSVQYDSTVLLFQSDSTNITSTTVDTICLYYDRSLKFISLACGYQYNFQLNKVTFTENVIDSAFISAATVDAGANDQHLQFILKKP